MTNKHRRRILRDIDWFGYFEMTDDTSVYDWIERNIIITDILDNITVHYESSYR